MKKLALASLASCLVIALGIGGCMNREPAPVCPVPIQVTANELNIGGFEGVDMIVVVDNSGSMAEEQKILATGFFTLINSLVEPVSNQGIASSADDVRVAIVTSDLGLQYSGKPGPVGAVSGCDAMGDNGDFQTYSGTPTVTIQDNEIDCDAGGGQCPNAQWACTGGKCQAPSGDGSAACPPLAGTYAELTKTNGNGNLAFQVACMAQTGTSGCGLEQQLESAAVGLVKHNEFVRENFLLAVLIVSDEEDCSIKDKGLYETPEFKDKVKGLNTACNYPPSNDTNFLYGVDRYKELYTTLKGNPNAVVFAAIVGVPTGSSSPCQGRGSDIGNNCLTDPAMQLNSQEFTDPVSDQKYWHFAPACVRDDVAGDDKVETEARPGRRYVQVAQSFGSQGYVYSICNKDWGPAMKDIASLIASQLAGTCYEDSLDWDPAGQVARCDVVANYVFNEPDQACPEVLLTSWLEQTGLSEDEYYAIVKRTPIYDDDKAFVSESVACPLGKIPVELSCAAAETTLAGLPATTLGWYYCEDSRENFPAVCGDGIDNDGNGKTDLEEPACLDCKAGGNSPCNPKGCKVKVQLTDAAKKATQGLSVAVQCLQQFSFEDENCQENTPAACNDGEDNDGNGVWDCEQDLKSDTPHLPDPNCCPMTKKDGACVIDERVSDICEKGKEADACVRAAQNLGCTI